MSNPELLIFIALGIGIPMLLIWLDHKWPNCVGQWTVIFILCGGGLLVPFYLFSWWLDRRKEKRRLAHQPEAVQK
jgi:hypothetical protein